MILMALNFMKREKPTSDQVLPAVAELVADKKHVTFSYIDLAGNNQQLDYRPLVDADPFPIPMPIDREGYSPVEHSDRYWATGHGDLLNVQNAISKYCDYVPQKLFDFGCSTGRFLRHVHCFTDINAHGCDFAPANVDWARRHLPADIEIVLNSALPDLPYEDESFCIVTAFSVFTHIDQSESLWLQELRRITKPGGILYLTIQNQSSWNKVIGRPGMLEHLKRANQITGNLHVNESLFAKPMPAQRISFRMSEAEIYNRNVWVTNEYVKSNWTSGLEILAIAECAHNSFQTVVILKRH